MLGLKRNMVLKETDFDNRGNIRASSLMYHFQEIAKQHASLLGYGFDDLMADDRIWVMTKLKFRVYKTFSAGEEYEFSTYPRKKRGVTWFRDYYVHDNCGNLVAAAVSHWCIINFTTRRIERAGIDFEGEYIDYPALEGGIEKIKLPDNMSCAGSHPVTESDLDVNDHVNNCRYADMIEEITGQSDYKEFVINFAKEARKGDIIEIYREKEGARDLLLGRLDDGTVIFQTKAVYRE